jgi:hypothetical protein
MDALQRSTLVWPGPPQVPRKFESLPREPTRTADVSPSAVTFRGRKLLISFVDGQNRTQEAEGSIPSAPQDAEESVQAPEVPGLSDVSVHGADRTLSLTKEAFVRGLTVGPGALRVAVND